jgi:hypothetical protein
MRLFPPLRRAGHWDFWDVAVIGNAFLNRSYRALASIEMLADNAHFSDLLYAPMAGGGGAAAPAAAPAAADADRASYAMSNPNWVADYISAMGDFVVDAVRPGLGGLIDAGIIVIGASREEVYQVMCTANWARRIVIGNPAKYVVTNVLSTVQIVSNRAEEDLSVHSYNRLVIALNVASQYPFAGTAGAAAIDQPNLLI